jgi:hypothetical protein
LTNTNAKLARRSCTGKRWSCFCPRHEGIYGEWRYITTYSSSQHQMEVNGQPHEPTAPGIHSIAGWVGPTGTLGGLGE